MGDATKTVNEKGKETIHELSLDDDLLKKMYRYMILVRTLDTRCMNLQRQGRIGFYVPSTGQEACQIGSAPHIQKGDWVFPTYRDQGVCLWAGYSLQKLVHQLHGNAEDACRGRQMPNHYSCGETNILSVSSPIATQLPQAVGCAYGMKLEKKENIVFAYMGDGGTSEGDFHVAMNFAGVWKAPVVFFCTNNQWAITVPREKQTASETIAQKAKAYGFEGKQVDGNCILSVYEAVGEAAEKARSGGGPTLIEALTYRMGPHSTSDDPRRYRDDAEVEEWEKRDPIDHFESILADRGIETADLRESYEAEAKETVNEAVKKAQEAGDPNLDSIFEDVYADMPPFLKEQLDELKDLPRQEGH